jgi:hypothetical protein
MLPVTEPAKSPKPRQSLAMAELRSSLPLFNAFGNLLGIGFTPEAAFNKAVSWHSLYVAKSFDSLVAHQAQESIDLTKLLLDVSTSRLYCLAHFANYPKLIIELAKTYRKNQVFIIIGAQPKEHEVRLAYAAQSLGVTAHFIKGDRQLIRKARNALAAGYPVVILVDVPWTMSKETNLSKVGSCQFGFFRGILTIEKLVRSIDPNFSYLMYNCDPRGGNWQELKTPSFSLIFSTLGKQLSYAPELFERLSSFQNYFTFHQTPQSAALIRTSSGNLVYCGANRGVWSVEQLPNYLKKQEGPFLVDDRNLADVIYLNTGVKPVAVLCF